MSVTGNTSTIMKRLRLFILAAVCIIVPTGIVNANDGTEAKPITPKALQTLLATIERVHPDNRLDQTEIECLQRLAPVADLRVLQSTGGVR